MTIIDKVNLLIDSKEAIEVSVVEGQINRITKRMAIGSMLNTFYPGGVKSEIESRIDKHKSINSKELMDELAAYFYDFREVRYNYSSLQKVRNVVREYINYNNINIGCDKVKIYFTREFNWKPGDYGDAGSCYWQSKAPAKDMIIRERGFAIKFHIGDKRLGRCWGTFLEEKKEEPSLLIFNGYSLLGNGNILQFYADTLYKALGYSDYFKVRLFNNGGRGNNILFINKNEGILITNKDIGSDDSLLDLRWKEIRTVTCNSCRGAFPEENTILVEEHYFCTNCAINNVLPCFNCGNLFLTRNIQKVTDNNVERTFCINCFGDLFAVCRFDCKVYQKKDMRIIDYGDYCYKGNLHNYKIHLCNCGEYNHPRRSWCWKCGLVIEKSKQEKTIEEDQVVKSRKKKPKLTPDLADLFVKEDKENFDE